MEMKSWRCLLPFSITELLVDKLLSLRTHKPAASSLDFSFIYRRACEKKERERLEEHILFKENILAQSKYFI